MEFIYVCVTDYCCFFFYMQVVTALECISKVSLLSVYAHHQFLEGLMSNACSVINILRGRVDLFLRLLPELQCGTAAFLPTLVLIISNNAAVFARLWHFAVTTCQTIHVFTRINIRFEWDGLSPHKNDKINYHSCSLPDGILVDCTL